MKCIEPFREEGGVLGFAVVMEDGTVIVRSHEEWRQERSGNKDFLRQLDDTAANVYWEVKGNPLPGRPSGECYEDPTLLQDWQRNLARTVYHLDDRYYQTQVSWEIATWFKEELPFAPRLPFYAPTVSGKSTVLNHVMLASHRGFDYANPTVAALQRELGQYHPTVCIDSWHKIHGDRKMELEQIYEKGFQQGGTVARVGQDDKVHRYPIYGWIAIATIHQPRAEDIQNRSVGIPMAEKPPNIKLERLFDLTEIKALKTRALDLRLAALSGRIDIQAALATAAGIAESYEPALSSRAIDIAHVLLVPGILMKNDDPDAILSHVLESQEQAKQYLDNSDQSDVFYAFQGVVADATTNGLDGKTFDFRRITTNAASVKLIEDLQQAGNLEDKKRPTTRWIFSQLSDLGFKMKSGKGAGHTTVFDESNFWQTYNRLVVKFGKRGEGRAAEGE